MLRRHGGDADVDVEPGDMQTRRAVLRQAPLGDVQPGQDLDARDQRLGQRLRGGVNLAQQAVYAHPHGQSVAKRLDVNVAGAKLHRLFKEIVDCAHHRRAAGQIAQAIDAFVGAGDLPLRDAHRLVVELAPIAQDRRYILEGGDLDLERRAQDNLRRLPYCCVARIADRQLDFPRCRLKRKNRRLAQKSVRKLLGQRLRFDQLRQGQTRQAIKRGDLVGKIIGRQFGRFPHLPKRELWIATAPSGITLGSIGR